MFACYRHWQAVPKWLQAALWRVYRPGQETDKNPSGLYLLVQRRCVLELARKDGREEAAAVEAQIGEWLRYVMAEGSPQKSAGDAEVIEALDEALKRRIP